MQSFLAEVKILVSGPFEMCFGMEALLADIKIFTFWPEL